MHTIISGHHFRHQRIAGRRDTIAQLCYAIMSIAIDIEPPSTPATLSVGAICPQCAYDLRGLSSPRCPECGEDLAPLFLGAPLVPWERRQQLGWLWAYLLTIAAVFQGKGKFCQAVCLPVDRRSAERFRLITATLQSVWLGVLLAFLLYTVLEYNEPDTLALSLWRWGTITIWITLSLSLYWLPGLFSHAFQANTLNSIHRERAMSLSLYLWCTLFLLFIPATCALGLAREAEIANNLSLAQWIGLAFWIAVVVGLFVLPRLFSYAATRNGSGDPSGERKRLPFLYAWCTLILIFIPGTLGLVLLLWVYETGQIGLALIGIVWLLMTVIDIIQRLLVNMQRLTHQPLAIRALRLLWFGFLGVLLVACFAVIGVSPLYLAVILKSLG